MSPQPGGYPRKCVLTMAHLPVEPVSALRARIEVPASLAVDPVPALALNSPGMLHTLTVSPGDQGEHYINLAIAFREPINLPPRLIEFVVRAPDPRKWPEPMIIRYFSALDIHAQPLRDARVELLVFDTEPVTTVTT